MIYLNVFGARYDDAEPCFLTTAGGKMVFDRTTSRWMTWASLNTKATADSHSWQPREVGIPSLTWQLNNSRLVGQRWYPGLDDTSGLASEAVTNGEDWTGATGTTPPTGWTAGGVAPRYTVDTGVMTLDSTGAGDVGMEQDVTVTPGTTYILEAKTNAGTTPWTISLEGAELNLPGGAREFALSFTPTGSTVTVLAAVDPTGQIVLDHIRVYEEAELTGAGAVTTGPVLYPVIGPYTSAGIVYWIDTDTCKAGFNLDDDSAPDLWLTWDQVEASDMKPVQKRAVRNKLADNGCTVSEDQDDG